MTSRTLDSTRPRPLRSRGAILERWIKTGHIRLWESDPEVMLYRLHTTSTLDAQVSGSDRRRSASLLQTMDELLMDVKTILTVRRVVTVDGLVAATNRLLTRLELPYRLLPLASTGDVVACVHVTEVPRYALACDGSAIAECHDRRKNEDRPPRLKSVA